METLRDVQKSFAADLWGEDLLHLKELIPGDELQAAQRFNIYRNNFLISLIDTLAAVYPVVEQLIGRECFKVVAEEYLRAYPSYSGNLQEFGHAFPNYLDQCPTVSMLPYLAGVARLEWSYHVVFHVPDPLIIEPHKLCRSTIDDFPLLRFSLGPACRLVTSLYPIFQIWRTNQPNYAGDDTVNLALGPESVLVIRPENEVELWNIDPAQSALLAALESGAILDDAVEVALQHTTRLDLDKVLARYLSSGVLVICNR